MSEFYLNPPGNQTTGIMQKKKKSGKLRTNKLKITYTQKEKTEQTTLLA
jgi:hypothetical protein